MKGSLLDAAWELFFGHRRRHRARAAGQLIWLEHAAEAAVLVMALSGPAPAELPDPLGLIEEEFERIRSRLADLDREGLLRASAAREGGLGLGRRPRRTTRVLVAPRSTRAWNPAGPPAHRAEDRERDQGEEARGV